jgi:hypothetical protein
VKCTIDLKKEFPETKKKFISDWKIIFKGIFNWLKSFQNHERFFYTVHDDLLRNYFFGIGWFGVFILTTSIPLIWNIAPDLQAQNISVGF